MPPTRVYHDMPTWADVEHYPRFVQRDYWFDDAWNCFAIDTRASEYGVRVAFKYDAALTAIVDARPHEAA